MTKIAFIAPSSVTSYDLDTQKATLVEVSEVPLLRDQRLSGCGGDILDQSSGSPITSPCPVVTGEAFPILRDL